MPIAIIPARGGSKRILRKNLKEFLGEPIISYAVASALASGLFEHVIVSTDDQDIAKLSRELGAEVPFLRPKNLSQDHTPTVPVIAHAIDLSEKLGWDVELVCCIYPCVPFIQLADLKRALELLEIHESGFCFPVTEFPSPVQRALKLNAENRLIPLFPENTQTRTQDLEATYHDAGQFYWAKKETWMTSSDIHSNAIGCIIPGWRVVDIDTPSDWERAEKMYRLLNGDEHE